MAYISFWDQETVFTYTNKSNSELKMESRYSVLLACIDGFQVYSYDANGSTLLLAAAAASCFGMQPFATHTSLCESSTIKGARLNHVSGLELAILI